MISSLLSPFDFWALTRTRRMDKTTIGEDDADRHKLDVVGGVACFNEGSG
jgi:hypothetical protein